MVDPDAGASEGVLGAERSSSGFNSTSRNVAASIRGTSASILVGYVTTLVFLPAILRAVGKDTYGVWAVIASLIAVGALADAGIRTEVMRRVAAAGRDGEQVRQILGEAFTLLGALAMTLATAGILAAPALRSAAFPDGSTQIPAGTIDNAIRAAAVILAVSLLANGLAAVLPGLQRADLDRAAHVIAAPLSSALTLGAAWAGWGLRSLVAGAAAHLLTATTLRFLALRRLLPRTTLRPLRLQRRVLSGYLGLSGLALLIQVSDVVDAQWDKLVLSRYIGSGAVASYQVAITLVQQVRSIAVIAIPILMVAMAEFEARADYKRATRAYRTLSALTLTAGTVLLGGVFAFGPVFVEVWLRTGDDDSELAVRLFALAMAINVLVAPWGARALAQERHALVALSAGCNVAVNLIASLMLTLAIGFEGALYGSIAGNGAGAIALLLALLRFGGLEAVRLPWRGSLVGVAAAAVVVVLDVPQHLSGWLSLGAAGILWLGVIGPLVFWLNGLKTADLRTLLQGRGAAT